MDIVKKLCIIPCGSAKVWDKNPNAGPQIAKDVYTGVFASTCQRYARVFFDHWVILSAKHGFLLPDDIVPGPYNVSFNKPSLDSIPIQALEQQAVQKGLLEFNEITVLGGKHYVDRVDAIFNKGQLIDLPLRDCKGIGYMLQWLVQALEGNNSTTNNLKETRTAKRALTQTDNISLSIGKYSPLFHYLNEASQSVITLTCEQIENIVGFSLPTSSIKHRAWWANDVTHSQAKAWLLADWEVEDVSLPQITFRRNQIS